jgi:hypothetical protein
VQDFADIDSFTLPVHLHSEAQARFVGRTIVDIYQGEYQPVTTRLSAEDLAASSSDLQPVNDFLYTNQSEVPEFNPNIFPAATSKEYRSILHPTSAAHLTQRKKDGMQS